jgi:hypothetical protein
MQRTDQKLDDGKTSREAIALLPGRGALAAGDYCRADPDGLTCSACRVDLSASTGERQPAHEATTSWTSRSSPFLAVVRSRPSMCTQPGLMPVVRPTSWMSCHSRMWIRGPGGLVEGDQVFVGLRGADSQDLTVRGDRPGTCHGSSIVGRHQLERVGAGVEKGEKVARGARLAAPRRTPDLRLRRAHEPQGLDAAQAYARLRAGTLQGRAVITPHR